MKHQSIKKILPILVFALGILIFSSCNRGYGCPNNFSIEQTAADNME